MSVRMTKMDSIVGVNGKRYVELAGLFNDTKPTDDSYATGSLFLEVDTGDVYAYDEDSSDWGKIASLGGGS